MWHSLLTLGRSHLATGCLLQGETCLDVPVLLLAFQVDVENYYITGGMLLPSYNQMYWMGLAVSGGKVRYIDPTAGLWRPSSYK
jgi:hypothetical protein